MAARKSSTKSSSSVNSGSAKQGGLRLGFWATLVVVLAALVSSYRWADSIKSRWYIFEPSRLHSLAQEAVQRFPDDVPSMITHITSTLATEHPSWTINTDFENPANWVFNNAGGAMGSMFIIHASITEYLIIFGTALGSEGHTGVHTADDYFNILKGEEWAYSAGSLVKEVYPAGSVHHLPRGQVKQYKFPDEGWALEYAQGWIPPMLPFGFADTFSSTLDFRTLYYTVKLTAESMISNLLHGKI